MVAYKIYAPMIMSLLWILLFSFPIARVSASCCSLLKVLRDGDFDYYDLTFPFDNRTYYFKPEGKSTSEDERPTQPVILTRGGTQFESPSGFDAEGAYVVDIPTEHRIVQMIVIDVSSKVNDNPNYVLVLKDLLSSTDTDTLQALSSAPSLLVLKFGWGTYYYQADQYVGYSPDTETYAFPVVGTEVAEWLTNNDTTRNVVGIAVDLPNVERNGSNGFPVHKTLAKGGVYIVENLNLNNINLPPHSCTISVMPVKKAGKSRITATLGGICQKNTCEEDNIKDIDKREDHNKKKHHKCKHHGSHESGGDEHSMHHGSHESGGDEHSMHHGSHENGGDEHSMHHESHESGGDEHSMHHESHESGGDEHSMHHGSHESGGDEHSMHHGSHENGGDEHSMHHESHESGGDEHSMHHESHESGGDEHSMHHESHESGGGEHSSHKSEGGEHSSHEININSTPSSGENSSQSSGTSNNNVSGSTSSITGGTASSNSNTTSGGSNSNSGSSKGPQKIINSVLKFKEIFNKDKQQQ